ncbi:hypothetical protein F8M41_009019 [Gigaspora margarita]|uniref:Uncharacterized protein n=1 Tax=Gigaspora margarita TaxID=4874 RepID=A0A8H3X4G3_GIGMA|nr:hypothetical protein F8M41_009019 [Gigaspora margarita]
MQKKLQYGYKRIQPGFHYYPTDFICDNLSMLKNFGPSCQFLNGTNETILMQGFKFGSGPYCIGDNIHWIVSKNSLRYTLEKNDEIFNYFRSFCHSGYFNYIFPASSRNVILKARDPDDDPAVVTSTSTANIAQVYPTDCEKERHDKHEHDNTGTKRNSMIKNFLINKSKQ